MFLHIIVFTVMYVVEFLIKYFTVALNLLSVFCSWQEGAAVWHIWLAGAIADSLELL